MKKLLLGTTALVAAGAFAVAAQADEMMEAPISAGVAGYTTAAISISSDTDDNTRGDSISIVNEFAVSGSTTLDNGITVAVSVQLGQSAGSWATGNGNAEKEAIVDEQHITLSGSFGSFRVGRTESAAFNATVSAPGAALGGIIGLNYPWYSVGGVNTFSGIGWEDAIKVVYTSPDFNGLTVGLSYAPEGSEQAPYASRATNDAGQVSGHTALGVSYSTAFMEGGSLSLGMAFETAEHETGDIEAAEGMKFGAVVSIDQLSFGGGMFDDENARHVVTGADISGMAYDVGASWTEGATQIGIQYASDETGGATATALHVNYNLGPGIDIGGQIGTASADAADDVTSFILGTSVSF